jgi:hypothetical protein
MDSATGSDSLAEWSQKIRNLQQQVNEDGLQEQARLEAEIAKSRMERANRRSTLTGNARIDQGEAFAMLSAHGSGISDSLFHLKQPLAIYLDCPNVLQSKSHGRMPFSGYKEQWSCLSRQQMRLAAGFLRRVTTPLSLP